ncbi:MAG: RHS repeat protein [Deltaproteobacteria bacterium]|nr:RHS repeat protein [Nannocystaceae bacterium]
MSIDVATGAMSLEVMDIGLFGTTPVSFVRHYDTANLARGTTVMGPGWRDGFDFRLRRTLEGFAYSGPTGSEAQFIDRGGELLRDGRLFAPGQRLELRRIDEKRLGVVAYGEDRGAIELLFEPIPERSGYRLVASRNSSDVRVDFTWSQGRLVAAQQHRERRMLHLKYDAAGRLVRIDALTDLGAPLGPFVRYVYDVGGRLTEVHDHNGPTHNYSYDGSGRILDERRRSGTVYSFVYDARGRCIHATGTDGLNQRWLEFDDAQRTTRVRDSHAGVWQHVYDERGQVTRTTAPAGDVTETSFDDDGRVARRTYPSGYSIAFGYDDRGRLASKQYPGDRVVAYAYDDRNAVVGYRDWRGHEIEIERDARSLMTAMQYPDGRRWERAYNAAGDIVMKREPDRAEMTFDYDALGRVRSRREPGGHVWSFEYDALGLPTRRVEPDGRVTAWRYDDHQRPSWRRLPDGREINYQYDSAGTTMRERRADGRVRSVRCSPCGHPLEIRDFEGRTARFEWDTEQWRMTKFVRPSGAAHEFVYDANGDLVEQRCSDGTTLRYEWEARRLVATIDAVGRRTEREYDELDHLIKLRNDDGEIEFQYDPVHCAVAKVISPDSVTEFVRDRFGRPIAELQNGVAIERAFDANGRVTGISTSLGDVGEFSYDDRGLCASAGWGGDTLSFAHDAYGRETRRDIAGVAVLEQEWDLGGRISRQSLFVGAGAGGPLREFRYDARGTLSITNDGSRGWQRLIHDGTDRLLAVDESGGTTTLYGYEPDGSRTWEVELSDEHRLIEEVFRGLGIPWDQLRDEAVRRGGSDGRHRYDTRGRLTEIRRANQRIAYDYDEVGQCIARTIIDDDTSRTWRFSWNASGRLIAATTPEGEIWRYIYDGAGRRIRKLAPDPAQSIGYVWDGTVLLYELTGDGRRLYGHHPFTGQLLYVHDGAPNYVLTDQVGAPAELLDADGGLRSVVRRSPWGRRVADDALGSGFPGQWYDAETGLYYNLHRYYDAEAGRYLSPDPAGLRGGFNSYGYVVAPGIYTDPTGEMRMGPVVVPASDVDTNRTQVNRPAGGEPYMGGHDNVTGNGGTSRVDLGGATVTDVHDGSNGLTHHVYNGRESGSELGTSRTSATDAGASTTRWWHSEQNAFTAALEGHIPLTGTGDIHFDISRPPCDPSHGHGCMDAVVRGYDLDGAPAKSLGQQLADHTGRPVVVSYPDPEGEGGDRVVHRFEPGCG